jgi:hypothetical protein
MDGQVKHFNYCPKLNKIVQRDLVHKTIMPKFKTFDAFRVYMKWLYNQNIHTLRAINRNRC